MPVVEDSERIRRSFWKRKLQAFYTLFDDMGPTALQTPLTKAATLPPSTGERWMRNEVKVEEALEYFDPFYGDMWTHLQGMLGARLPPVDEGSGALVREATRLLNADYPEDKSVDAVIAAVEHCRRQEASQRRVFQQAGTASGRQSDDRRQQERKELARTLRQIPLWARGALTGGVVLDSANNPSIQPILLSSVVLLRCLFRRKLEAYYALVDDNKTLADVDECMMHFLNEQRKIRQEDEERERGKADGGDGGDELSTASLSYRKVYESMVQTWMERHNRALVGPGLEVRSEAVVEDKRRFLLELEAFHLMWVRVQDAYSFFIPPVEVSPRTFNEEVSRVLFRLPPLIDTQALSPLHHAAPQSRPPHRCLTTPAPPPQVDEESQRAVVTHSGLQQQQLSPKSSNEAAALYKNLDMSALDDLPTAAFVADYHYKRRLAKGSVSQTTKVSMVVSGIPFRAYRQLSSSERGRVNECLVMDISALMSQKEEHLVGGESQGAVSRPKQGSGGDDQPVPSPKASDGVRASRSRNRSKVDTYEFFDAKSLLEQRRNQIDGISPDADQRAFALPKSPFAPPHGGRLVNLSGAYGANIVVLPIDTTITSVQYHVPSQGLEVTLLMTPTPDGTAPVGLDRVRIEERLHMDYLPRLMSKVLRGVSSPPAARNDGVILTLTEEVCAPLGITLQQCPSGIYHSVPKLVDVKISIQTSLNRTT